MRLVCGAVWVWAGAAGHIAGFIMCTHTCTYICFTATGPSRHGIGLA